MEENRLYMLRLLGGVFEEEVEPGWVMAGGGTWLRRREGLTRRSNDWQHTSRPPINSFYRLDEELDLKSKHSQGPAGFKATMYEN